MILHLIKIQKTQNICIFIRLTWCFNALVVEGVNAHFIPLEVEGKLATIKSAQFVVTLEIWPAPQSAVYDMWQTLEKE